MFVRMTTLQGDKGAIAAGVDYVENTARAAVEEMAGNRGFASFTDAASGVIVGASYWDSAESRAASEGALADVRAGLATAGGGDISFENYEAVVAKRLSIPAAGAVVRLVRLEVRPNEVDDLIAFYRSDILPRITSPAGVCSAQLLVDRATGRAVGISAWDDQAALDTAEAELGHLVEDTKARLGVQFTGIELYSMVRTNVRLV